MGRLLRRWFPLPVAQACALAVVVLLASGASQAIVHDGFLPTITEPAAATNDLPGTSPHAPTGYTRSGSPQSLVSWASLGMQGRSFFSSY